MTFGNSCPEVETLSSPTYLFGKWFLGIVSIFVLDLKPVQKPLLALLLPPKKDTTATGGTALPTIRQEVKKFGQYASTLFATVGSFTVGAVLAWMSPAMPMLLSPSSKIKVTPNQGSWVGSLITIDAIYGSIKSSILADTFGRKFVIFSLAIPFIVCWTIIYFATNVWKLYLARLIAGSCPGGINTTVPMYIEEIAESSIRSKRFFAELKLFIILRLFYCQLDIKLKVYTYQGNCVTI